MSEIKDWSVTDGNNNAAPPDGAPENTTKLNQVNNIMRAMMGVLARWNKDIDGYIASSGSVNAYSVTLNRSLLAYYDGLTFMWRAHVVNTGPCTLSVNGLPPKGVIDHGGQELKSAEFNGRPLFVTYYGGVDKFILHSSVQGIQAQPQVGTRMLFVQNFMPTGWALVTVDADRLALIGSGSGGAQGGSWAISGLNTENNPHLHTFSGNTGAPSASFLNETSLGTNINYPTPDHYHGVSGTTSTENAGHSHTGDGTWRPSYVIVLEGQRVS